MKKAPFGASLQVEQYRHQGGQHRRHYEHSILSSPSGMLTRSLRPS